MEIIKSDKQLLSFKPPGLGIIYYAVMDNQYRFWSLEVRFCGNKNLICGEALQVGSGWQLDLVTLLVKAWREMKRMFRHLRGLPKRNPDFGFLCFVLCT